MKSRKIKTHVQGHPGQFHKAKKSLGQNFLKSQKALNKIIETGEIKKSDIILEIGPGKGILTERLLEKADKVIAVEKDRNLVSFLKEKFQKEIKEKKLILIEDDILDISIKNLLLNFVPQNITQTDESSITIHKHENIRLKKNKIKSTINYKIIANIPYNITGAILKKFLEKENQPKLMVLMVQYEVAKRILGENKKENLLSISVKTYGEPKLIMKVAKRYFSPAPKVDSAIISIKNISKKFFTENKIKEKNFWKIVKKGFSHKRKKLSNNLNSPKVQGHPGLWGSWENIKNKRAEELSLKDWENLIK